MVIREQYELLLNKEYKFSLINEVNALKDECIKQNNQEYIYKCNLLISDIYIDHDNKEEALNILLKDIKAIDQVIFKNIYLDYLDRLIYLYINRRNYNVAIKFISQKEKLINHKESNVLNRLYLEFSYAYGEMGKFDMSEMYLQKILQNNPDESLKSYVLSNLTKIYIDKEDIQKTKDTLNMCLSCATDHEGEIYNDYLLAKLCILEKKFNEAVILFENIFVNEEINAMTLSIMNDYLKLLNNLKQFDKALLLMNKLSLFMNAVDDLGVKKAFYHNKLEYFAGINDNHNVSNTMKEIELIEKEIAAHDEQLQNISFEEEKNNIVEKAETDVFNKIDLLTSMVNIALKGDSLRNNVMDFANKVQKVVPYDELQFVLFNKVNEQEFQITDYVTCFKYKNKRLYEKNISYESLKSSIVEMLVTKNRSVAIDYNSSNINLVDLFSGDTIDKNSIKYLNSIPCIYNDDTFAALIYISNSEDLTEHANTVLLKVATKLLESSLVNLFIQEDKLRIENTLNMVVKENNISLFYLNNNTMYLSEALKNILQTKFNSISREDYINKIAKSDIDRYINQTTNSEKYAITYRYELGDKIIQLVESLEPCKDANGKIMYYQGTIKSLEKDSLGYALAQNDLNNKLFELKRRSNEIEFKFSIIKIKGSVDEYLNVKSTFGVEPYYLSDGTYVVILENEVNQRTLDRLVKNFITRSAIVRFPRDIINIDEMLNIADLMLEYNNLYFTNDIYLGYIKKNNLKNKINSLITKDLQIRKMNFNTYSGSELIEIKPVIYGLDEKERIRKYLNKELQQKFDKKFLETFLSKHIRINSFFDLSNEYIYKVFNEYDLNKFENTTFVMYEYNKLTVDIFDKLKEHNLKIIIDVNLVDKLDTYYFTTNLIKGIFISENIDVNEFNKVLRIANMFNLTILSYNNSQEYEKLCYYSGENIIID